jgi:hypothetical protein
VQQTFLQQTNENSREAYEKQKQFNYRFKPTMTDKVTLTNVPNLAMDKIVQKLDPKSVFALTMVRFITFKRNDTIFRKICVLKMAF